MKNSVCFHCPLRHEACHADCPRGTAEEKQNAIDRKQRCNAKQVEIAIIDSVVCCASGKGPRFYPKYIKQMI